MLVKNNNVVNEIEAKMGFVFKELEIIGKYEVGKVSVVFYRNLNEIFAFHIFDSNQVTAIIRIAKLTSDNVKLQYEFEVEGKIYNYEEDLMLFINRNEEMVSYTFYDHSYFNFCNEQKLELADEEAVIIILLDEFFDDSKI